METVIVNGQADMRAVQISLAIKFLHGLSKVAHRLISYDLMSSVIHKTDFDQGKVRKNSQETYF